MTLLKHSLSNLVAQLPRLPHRHDTVFSLIFFLYLFLPLVFITVIDEGFETPKMAFFLIVLGSLLVVMGHQMVRFFRLPKYFNLLFGLFALTIILSTLFSLDLRNSLFGLMGRPSNSAIFLISWVILIYVLYSTLNRDKLLSILRVIVFGGFLVSIYSLLQQEGIGYYEGVNAGIRAWAPSFLGNPNFNSMYLAMVVPIAIYFLSNTKRLPWRFYFATSTFLMLWVIAQSASRAAILAVAVALFSGGLMLLFRKKFGVHLIAVGTGLILFCLMAYLALNVYRPDSISQSLQFQETNQQSRLVVWDMSADMILNRPWTGTGLSNYFIGFNQYGWSPVSFGERFDDPHNVFLLLGVSGGFPMLIVFTVMLGSILLLAWKGSRADSLHIALIGAVIAWIVAGSFGPVVVACWTLLGLVIVGVLLSYRSQSSQLSPVPRYVTQAVGSVLIILGVVLISTYIFLHFAKENYEHGNYPQALKMANLGFLWDAANSRVGYYQLRSMLKLNYPAEQIEDELLASINRKPNAAASYVSAATIYWHLWARTGEAKYLQSMDIMVSEALLREPNYANSHTKFAYLYFKAGKLEQALHHQRLSITYHNNQFYGWVLLSKLYYDLNQRDQFLYAYAKASAMNEESFLIKGTLRAYREIEDISSMPFPVIFPDPE